MDDIENISFSQLFHQASKDLSRGHPPVPPDDKDWPDEWKTTYYKAYPRLPKIDLDNLSPETLAKGDDPPSADFFELIKNRKSRRDFSGETMSKRELSLLLKYSCGNIGPLEDDRKRRAHPSGGARFPIEIYPVVFHGSDDLKTGLYHYNIKHHQLDVLWDRDFTENDIGELFTYPFIKKAPLVLALTAVFWRNQNKYGERGYRMVLQESGHIGQNVYLIAEALKLKCVALAGTRDEKLEEFIDIDGVTESVVYALAIGK